MDGHPIDFHVQTYKLYFFHLDCFKGELRGKNEVILYDWPIFSALIFDNSFC